MGRNASSAIQRRRSVLSFLGIVFFSCVILWDLGSVAAIPAQYDGFAYPVGSPVKDDSVVVEAFFDPVCPDSRDAWLPLKRIIHEYSPRIFLIVHPFPLPYHDNSFFSCRALHISNSLNKSSTYPLLELFFDRQEELYNVPTRAMSRENIIKLIVELIAEVTSDKLAIENGFKDVETDLAARTSFKYGCSRGVIGTPFFLVNGFALPGAGSALDYEQWQSIISPLLVKSSEEEEKASFALF
ncbi:thioredoxin superfamily protein isoform X1 [Wolffia australiana]